MFMNNAPIQRLSIIFLQAVLIVIGIGTLAFLLVEPHFEGRNVNATLFAIYFNDPFLAYVYLGSIPAFVALYQAFKVLGYARSNTVFSRAAVNALRAIQYCMLLTAGAIVLADGFLMLAAHGEDDPAGAVMLGIIATGISLVIAAGAAVLESILKNAVAMKSKLDVGV